MHPSRFPRRTRGALVQRLLNRARRVLHISGHAPFVGWRVISTHFYVLQGQNDGRARLEDPGLDWPVRQLSRSGTERSRLARPSNEGVNRVRDAHRRILRYYEEGRITPTGFILDFRNNANRDDLGEMFDVILPDLRTKLRDFVVSYRPGMKVFRRPPPDPSVVSLAKELLTGTIETPSVIARNHT